MRIVSLLPAATEMIYAIGLQDQLVGVSHECVFPPAARQKPVVMHGVLPIDQMSQAEIDAEVSRRLRVGEPLYDIDAEQLDALAPDLVITQELCEVCAASPRDLAGALAMLKRRPDVLQLTPRSLAEVLQNIRDLGVRTQAANAAANLVARCAARIERVRVRAANARERPRVFCMEWIDPAYCSGHWVPEMVEIAGGTDQLSRKGTDSVRIPWQAVLDFAPEVLVVMPCGYQLAAIKKHAEVLPALAGWAELPAVRAGRVFAANASAYFACPGPRLVDGIELLAHLIHPELFAWDGPSNAFAPLQTKACARCEQPFLCHPGERCWCEDEPLPAGTADLLCGTYGDCLCPRCLAPTVAALPA